MVSICGGLAQSDPKIGRCRVVGQAISINYDAKFVLSFPVVQMKSC